MKDFLYIQNHAYSWKLTHFMEREHLIPNGKTKGISNNLKNMKKSPLDNQKFYCITDIYPNSSHAIQFSILDLYFIISTSFNIIYSSQLSYAFEISRNFDPWMTHSLRAIFL